MDKVGRIGKWVAISLFLIGGVLVAWNQFRQNHSLRDNGEIVSGTIYDQSDGNVKAPGIKFRYNFIYNGKKYTGTSSLYYSDYRLNHNIFKGKTFPVIVDADNIQNNDLIVTARMFIHYEIEMPDSLKWVQAYIN